MTSEGATAPVKLEVGEKTQVQSAVYARVVGAPRIFTIASYVESSLDKKPFDLRDRDFLKVRRDAVRTLEIQGPDGRYALARDDKGEWGFTAPIVARAGRWSVDGLLGAIEALRMDAIAADDAKDLKPFGLTTPSRTVKLGLADGNTRSLEIGSETTDKKWHARLSGSTLVALIPPALVDDLKKGMAELRAKRLLDVAPYEIDAFDVEAGARRVSTRSPRRRARTVSRPPSGSARPRRPRIWRPPRSRRPSSSSEALMPSSSSIPPKAPAAYGLDAPVFRLTLRSAGKDDLSLEIGKKDIRLGPAQRRSLHSEARVRQSGRAAASFRRPLTPPPATSRRSARGRHVAWRWRAQHSRVIVALSQGKGRGSIGLRIPVPFGERTPSLEPTPKPQLAKERWGSPRRSTKQAQARGRHDAVCWRCARAPRAAAFRA